LISQIVTILVKILLIEDDQSVGEMLKQVLTTQHYLVDVATDGQAGWELAETFEYDLILLDLILPKLDGIAFCQQRRSQGDTTLILLLTAQDTSSNKVLGLDAGADDYVVKPFNINELLARIRALRRRGSSASSPILVWQDLHLDLKSWEVTYGGQLLNLTAKEYALLELFLRNHHRVFSQSALLDHLWSLNEFPTENAVRDHIKSLRRKLKQAGVPSLIETVYGLGYRVKTPDTEAKESETETGEANLPAAMVSLPPPIDLAEIWERVKPQYVDRIAVIEQAIVTLQTGILDESLRHQSQREAHTLAGSLGSFGFEAASQLAQKIEQRLKVNPLNERDIEPLLQLVDSLHHALATPEESSPASLLNGEKPSSQPQILEQPFHVGSPQGTRLSLGRSIRLLIVEDDPALVERLSIAANAWGMEVQTVTNFAHARKSIDAAPPDIVLLNLNLPGSSESGLTLLTELTATQPPIPVVVLTAEASFADRVNVARLRGRGFFQKPIAPTQVLEAITHILRPLVPLQSKLLIVDDDLPLLEMLCEVLEPWGFQLTVLSDPHQFWMTLEQVVPDLLILDVEMPGINGIDLCHVVRNDARWHNLPLLFLSAQTDPATIQQVFMAGADDYVSKPIVAAELIARVLNRLERSQALRKLADIDALTQVANRRKAVYELNRLLQVAGHYQQPLCFALLDLDHFKQVNDQHGHAGGDKVLVYLSELLKQYLGSENIVARWGGEEFVVILPGVAQEEVMRRLTEVREIFHHHQFLDSRQQVFGVSFSGGIAMFPVHGIDLQTLYQAADSALFRAKAVGRNRICEA